MAYGTPVCASCGAVDGKLGTAALVAQANSFANDVRPTVETLRASGLSLNAVAKALAAQGVQTARGGAWTETAVRNLRRRR